MIRSADDEGRQMETLMILEEVARFLRLSNDTVYRLVNAGKLPASKVGDQWRFRKQDVDEWFEKNKNIRWTESTRTPRKRKSK